MPETKEHKLGCDDYHQHTPPNCCALDCWCLTKKTAYMCLCYDAKAFNCPEHTVVERVKRLLSKQRSEIPFENQHWLEVTCQGGEGMVFLESSVPAIFVVRGSQMFKLKWPELPPKDPKKGSMRED